MSQGGTSLLDFQMSSLCLITPGSLGRSHVLRPHKLCRKFPLHLNFPLVSPVVPLHPEKLCESYLPPLLQSKCCCQIRFSWGLERETYMCVCVCVCVHVYIYAYMWYVDTPTAHRSSQARGHIWAAAAGHSHSHSHARSKPRLRPTPQLLVKLDLSPAEWSQGWKPLAHGDDAGFLTHWATVGAPPGLLAVDFTVLMPADGLQACLLWITVLMPADGLEALIFLQMRTRLLWLPSPSRGLGKKSYLEYRLHSVILGSQVTCWCLCFLNCKRE